MPVDREIEEIKLNEIYNVINDCYVSKLLKYLSGESTVVSSHGEFTKVYQLIINHCDNQDNNLEVHECFTRFVSTYFDEEVIPRMAKKSNDELL